MKPVRLYALLISLLLLFMGTTPIPTEAYILSGLKNNGFEKWDSESKLADGWNVNVGMGSIKAEKDDCTEGSLSVRITSENAQMGELYAATIAENLQPGALYELSLDCKLPEAMPENHGLMLHLFDTNGIELVNAARPIYNTDGEWLRIAYLFTVPTDGKVKIRISFIPNGEKHTVLFDNLMLMTTEKGKTELYKSPVGYVVDASCADPKSLIPAFYNGTITLSGEKKAKKNEHTIARIILPEKKTTKAYIAGYEEKGKKLTDLAVFSFSGGYGAADIINASAMKLYFWNTKGFAPVSGASDAAFSVITKEIPASGDFESYIGKRPAGWKAVGAWGQYCIFEQDSQSGNHRMKINKPNNEVDPYVYQRVPLAPNTKYKLSVYCTQENMTEDSGAGVKLEFYDREKVYISQKTERFPNNKQNHSFEFETPPGTAEAALLLRVYINGTAYFDNVVIKAMTDTPAGSITTDAVFYAPSRQKGTMVVTANTITFPEAENGSFDVCLRDGNKVLYGKNGNRLINGSGAWDFPIDPMTEEGRPYTLEAQIYDADGISCGSFYRTVYMYERPSVLDAEGNYHNPDGSVFVPRIAYHVAGQQNALTEEGIRNYKYARDAGMNVIQLSTGCIYDPDNTLRILDILESLGLKALLPLYDKGYAAGNVYHKARTKTLVEKVKDHPAVFAYGVYDEPDIGTNGLTEQDLIDSYTVIRDMDKKHPTYVVVAPAQGGNSDIARISLTKYTDVVCYDPYPACWNDVPSTYIYETIAKAKAGVMPGQPVYALLQVFDWRGFFPSANEYRHMWYQAMMAGASGVGIYSFMDALTADNGDAIGLWSSSIWNDITEFAKEERDEAEKHFLYGAYPLFNEGVSPGYRYHAWEKDDKIYMVILRTDNIAATSAETSEEIITDIPLVGQNGREIGAFTAKCIYGNGKDQTKSGSRDLAVRLGHREALVYEISGE